jgi:thioredoxin 1
MADIAQITTDTFEASVGGDTPTLVDFWAEWCAPCRAIAPILGELANEYDTRLNIVKLNADEHPDVVNRLGILSIPTLILFKKGEEQARIVGARPKEHLVREIEPHLQSASA